MLDGLRAAGRMTIEVAGREVELDGGRLVAVDGAPVAGPVAGGPGETQARRVAAGLPGRAEADELLAVARWLRREARAGSVRVAGPVTPIQAAALATVLEGMEGSPA